MIGIPGGVVIAAIATVSVLAALKADRFHVERQAAIDAPPEIVFACLNDLQRWSARSPWEKKTRPCGATLAF